MKNGKLKGYFWRPSKDSEYGIGIIAHSVKEAKKVGWHEWGREFGNDESWIDIECHLKKDVDVSGIKYPCAVQAEDNNFEGLKRNLYDWIETECPICGHEDYIKYNSDLKLVACDDCIKLILNRKVRKNDRYIN